MNFPASLDTLTNPGATEVLGTAATVGVAQLLSDLNDIAELLEAKVGVDSSAVTSSLDYLVKNTSSSDPGHKHTLANGATDVTSSATELNVLDGIPATLTATELGYVDGVTSAIQTQMDLKAPLASPTFTGDVGVATTANIQVNGADPKRGIYVPASSMYPSTTAGCAPLAQYETGTNDVNMKVLDFDQTTEEAAEFNLPAPDYWDLSTVTVIFYWTAASGTGDVIWALKGLSLSNDDALDTAFGTAQTVTDTLIAANDLHITSATSAITIGGTPAKSDNLYFKVYRDADAGGDTFDTDARLIGIKIKFGISQYDDQ